MSNIRIVLTFFIAIYFATPNMSMESHQILNNYPHPQTQSFNKMESTHEGGEEYNEQMIHRLISEMGSIKSDKDQIVQELTECKSVIVSQTGRLDRLEKFITEIHKTQIGTQLRRSSPIDMRFAISSATSTFMFLCFLCTQELISPPFVPFYLGMLTYGTLKILHQMGISTFIPINKILPISLGVMILGTMMYFYDPVLIMSGLLIPLYYFCYTHSTLTAFLTMGTQIMQKSSMKQAMNKQ